MQPYKCDPSAVDIWEGMAGSNLFHFVDPLPPQSEQIQRFVRVKNLISPPQPAPAMHITDRVDFVTKKWFLVPWFFGVK